MTADETARVDVLLSYGIEGGGWGGEDTVVVPPPVCVGAGEGYLALPEEVVRLAEIDERYVCTQISVYENIHIYVYLYMYIYIYAYYVYI